MSAKKKLTEAELLAARRKDTYEWIECFAFALIICIVIFIFFVKIITVKGSSMNPSLFDTDKMIVSDLFFKPEPGDVVVFKTDSYDPDKALVKRVIATEGQVVNIDFDKGEVIVDSEVISEDYIAEATHNKLDFIVPQTVPEGCVFVMGDNRNASNDSRDKRIGMVDERLILGKAYRIIYPIGRARSIE